MITVSKISEQGTVNILLQFAYDLSFKNQIKSIPEARYTATHKGWKIPYDAVSWAAFKKLELQFCIQNIEIVQNANIADGPLTNKIDIHKKNTHF